MVLVGPSIEQMLGWGLKEVIQHTIFVSLKWLDAIKKFIMTVILHFCAEFYTLGL